MKHNNIIRLLAGMLLATATQAILAADGHLLKVTDISIDRLGDRKSVV